MLQKVTRLDSVPTAEETVLTTEVPTKESRLYTLLDFLGVQASWPEYGLVRKRLELATYWAEPRSTANILL